MQRLRLYDLRNSRLPSLIGKCQNDLLEIANYVNTAQRRLLYAKEGVGEGWWGGWAEIAFNVSRNDPYITLPREIARLEFVDACDCPIQIHNQFFEYLRFGNGRLPKNFRCRNACGILSGYTRNNAITFTEMTNAPQYITAYMTDAQDEGKKTLIQGLDANGEIITSQNVATQIEGTFLTLVTPSAQTPMTLSQINGIQKDVTVGVVRYYQHDPTTGDEILLLTMQPSETTAMYRRYYLNQLPRGCCCVPGANDDSLVQVTAIAKLELIPVVSDTDYTLIQNQEAITEECQSVRYSEMDNPGAKQMAAERHIQAIKLLNGELNHYVGKNDVAVQFYPFGTARLNRSYRKTGRLI